MITTDRYLKRHLMNGKPLYEKTFDNVMSFHDGIAAILDKSCAYHINLSGNPIYETRFKKTYGFYYGIAAVEDESGAYHIDVSGMEIYPNRYRWVGNFQNGRCAVRLKNGKYTHIDEKGKLCTGQYDYAGDFREDAAVVRMQKKGATHIDKNGDEVHGKWFVDCKNYNNSMAVVSDGESCFYINKSGNQIEKEKYRQIQEEYNGETVVYENNTVLSLRKGGNCIRLYEIPYKMPENNETFPAWIQDLYNFSYDSCVVVMRHGDRPAESSFSPDVENRGELTESGIEKAVRIGGILADLKYDSLSIWTSPINRCVKTSEYILKGIGVNAEIKCTEVLGNPGTAFIYDTEGSDVVNRLPITFTAMRHLEGQNLQGWYPINVCINKFLDFISEDLEAENSLTFCITHDNFVVRLIKGIAKIFPRDSWTDFFEGAMIIREGKNLSMIWNGKKIPIDIENVSCDTSILSAEYISSIFSMPDYTSVGELSEEGIQAIIRNEGAYHIDSNGNALYKEKYTWVGDFKEGLAAVRDENHRYFHIRSDGLPISNKKYGHVTDFKYSIAVVSVDGYGSTHITDHGEYLHNKWFIECKPYHKGCAEVRDHKGWFHINVDGKQLYNERYLETEPFYNGCSLCLAKEGYIIRHENGFEEKIIDLVGHA
jgi:Phosphohistidine phosphatase SixA